MSPSRVLVAPLGVALVAAACTAAQNELAPEAPPRATAPFAAAAPPGAPAVTAPPVASAAPAEEEAATPTTRTNRARLTDPATKKRWFSVDMFDLLLDEQRTEPPPAGLWALEVAEGARIDREVVTGNYSVVYVTRAGTKRGPAEEFRLATDDSEVQHNVPSTISPPGLFDFDGDGTPELLFPVGYGVSTRAGYIRQVRVYTVKKDGVEIYLPTKGWSIAVVDDFDGDGRPDFWLDTRGTMKDMQDGNGPRHSSMTGDGFKVAHSLPDGRFSTTDAVARNAKWE